MNILELMTRAGDFHTDAQNSYDCYRFPIGDEVDIQCLLDAVIYESRAALLLPNDPACEPSRGILFRSAAWLCVNLARALANDGLKGALTDDIKRELRDVLEFVDIDKEV